MKKENDIIIVDKKSRIILEASQGLALKFSGNKTKTLVTGVDERVKSTWTRPQAVVINKIQSDISELKSGVSELKSDVLELKSDVSELKIRLTNVEIGVNANSIGINKLLNHFKI